VDESGLDAQAEAQAAELFRAEYARTAVAAYVERWLEDRRICYSKDIGLSDDKAYIMSMLAVLTGNDPQADYLVQELEGTYTENAYTIPQLQIMHKERKNEP